MYHTTNLVHTMFKRIYIFLINVLRNVNIWLFILYFSLWDPKSKVTRSDILQHLIFVNLVFLCTNFSKITFFLTTLALAFSLCPLCIIICASFMKPSCLAYSILAQHSINRQASITLFKMYTIAITRIKKIKYELKYERETTYYRY